VGPSGPGPSQAVTSAHGSDAHGRQRNRIAPSDTERGRVQAIGPGPGGPHQGCSKAAAGPLPAPGHNLWITNGRWNGKSKTLNGTVSPPAEAHRDPPDLNLAGRWLDCVERHGYGLYLGNGRDGPVFARPQHGALVLGPPRCGKTASVVIPNVLGSCGPVVAVSTKPDILEITSTPRLRVGPCYLFDPSGTVNAPAGVQRVAWSPLHASRRWDGAIAVAEAMVLSARPGGDRGESAHWLERASALLSVAFHAGAIGDLSFAEVMEAIDRRQAADFADRLARADSGRPASDPPASGRADLARADANRAGQLLAGIRATDSREQSGIWSTASSVLSAYRTRAALDSTEGPALDAARLVDERATLYVCAGSDEQRQAAPLVAGILRDLRTAAYRRHATLHQLGGSGPPLVFALDEVANIAPLHDLPTLVAEGGSQGVVTLACLQDLSQAEGRWGRVAGGFLTLFQAKLIFPGIADTRTLEAISLLAGEVDVPHVSSTRSPVLARLWHQSPTRTTTVSTRRERRFPVDVVAQLEPGVGLHLDGTRPQPVRITPWFDNDDLRAIVQAHLVREPAGRSRTRPEPDERSRGRRI